MTSDPSSLGRRVARRVLRLRCPQCGAGVLFRRYGRLRERCRECGLVYRREQGAQTGSMYLSAAVTEVFAAICVFVVFFLTDWDLVLSLAVSVPVVVAFCFAFLPWSQAIWVGVEYATDVHNRESWVDPRP